MKINFKEKFDQISNKTNLAKTALADRLGVTTSNIYRLINNQTSYPSVEFLLALEDELGISMNWFLRGEGEMMKSDNSPKEVESEGMKDLIEQLKEVSRIKDQRIKDLEFIANLYRSEKVREDKSFSNFNPLGIDMSLVNYLEDKVIDFASLIEPTIISFRPTGNASGAEAVSA